MADWQIYVAWVRRDAGETWERLGIFERATHAALHVAEVGRRTPAQLRITDHVVVTDIRAPVLPGVAPDTFFTMVVRAGNRVRLEAAMATEASKARPPAPEEPQRDLE